MACDSKNVYISLFHLMCTFLTALLAYENEIDKPSFDVSDNFFSVTLPNLNYKKHDEINDEMSDFDLEVLKTIDSNPGVKVPIILKKIQKGNEAVSLNMIRNSIRRKLQNYIEFKGSRKTGGYFIKKS